MPTVVSLSVTHGPAGGSTLVTVTGTGFVSYPGLLAVRFGSVAAMATLVTASKATCYSPPHAAALVAVELSNNNQDFSTDGIAYTFDRAFCSSW
jgi:hypothetical protein